MKIMKKDTLLWCLVYSQTIGMFGLILSVGLKREIPAYVFGIIFLISWILGIIISQTEFSKNRSVKNARH